MIKTTASYTCICRSLYTKSKRKFFFFYCEFYIYKYNHSFHFSVYPYENINRMLFINVIVKNKIQASTRNTSWDSSYGWCSCGSEFETWNGAFYGSSFQMNEHKMFKNIVLSSLISPFTQIMLKISMKN